MLYQGDHLNPEWGVANRVHDWRNYINASLRDAWSQFTDEQKRLIADNADEQAMKEEWD